MKLKADRTNEKGICCLNICTLFLFVLVILKKAIEHSRLGSDTGLCGAALAV